jgi:hypothetical protein
MYCVPLVRVHLMPCRPQVGPWCVDISPQAERVGETEGRLHVSIAGVVQMQHTC